MRKLALWAKFHPKQARIYIIILHLVLGLLAYILAKLLQVSGFTQDVLLSLSIGLFLVLVLIYPSHRSTSTNKILNSFAYRKCCDFLVIICSFTAVFAVDSKIFNPSPIVEYAYAASNVASRPKPKKPTAQEVLSSLEYRDKSTLTRTEKRVLKKEFKKQLKKYVVQKVTGKKAESNKTLYIILTIVGAIGVFAVIAALSCELGCNGAETASILVVILGLIGVILGAFFLIRRINRGPKKTPEEKENEIKS